MDIKTNGVIIRVLINSFYLKTSKVILYQLEHAVKPKNFLLS